MTTTLETTTVEQVTLTATRLTKMGNAQKFTIDPLRRVDKQTTPQAKAISEPMQPTDSLPKTKTSRTESSSTTGHTEQHN